MQKLALLATTLFAAAACSDTDAPLPAAADAQPPVTATTFTVRLENVAPWTVLKSGTQATKTSGTAGAIGPSEAFELQFTAGRGQRISFAAMLGASNDWFFGPGPDGIALYDADARPISGDVTDQIKLWNAGTEIDQEPGVGAFTGPKQAFPEQGDPDPDPTVREVPPTVTLSGGASFTRPAVSAMLKATLTAGANRSFTLRVENVAQADTLATSQGPVTVRISPLVWALHIKPAPLFEPGVADRSQGLELVAESGRGLALAGSLWALTGRATPASPGVWVVHDGVEPLYGLGLADRGLGLARIAEDGNIQPLRDALASGDRATAIASTGSVDTPEGATAAGPIKPGGAYMWTISALPGQRLSFASMFGMSNDWFFAAPPEGLALFEGDGTPIAGDVTSQLGIYDAGSELDEELAIGPDTGPQQPAPDTGPADPVNQVREVPAAEYAFPASAHLRMTITPQ